MEQDSTSEPVLDKERTFTTSDGIDKDSETGLGPSAFSGTERPYLARVFDISSTDILQLGLRDSLAEVDSFILNIISERNWVDSTSSYQTVLSELKDNLGIHPNLEPLRALNILNSGVKLLRLQKMHRRRDLEIQKSINRLSK